MPWKDPKKKAAWARANPEKVRRAKVKFKLSGGEAALMERQRETYRQRHAVYLRTERGEQAKRRGRGQPEPTRPRPSRCECCGMSDLVFKKPLCLDHCHLTNKFRGWICDDCNIGIGRLGDDVEGVRRALDYLKRIV